MSGAAPRWKVYVVGVEKTDCKRRKFGGRDSSGSSDFKDVKFAVVHSSTSISQPPCCGESCGKDGDGDARSPVWMAAAFPCRW